MSLEAPAGATPAPPSPSLATVLREWGRIGCIGFGGPPTHIALLRDLCVRRRGWMTDTEFEDALAACNLLPGPASTQLAIYCAWRVRGRPGAFAGAAGFILPGLIVIIGLAALFLGSPPLWVRGAGAGAGAAVAAVALQAGTSLLRSGRTLDDTPGRTRRLLYLAAGAAAAATVGSWLVLVILGCGALELARPRIAGGLRSLPSLAPLPLLGTVATGGLASLAWVAFKVGALSFGGGFVIIPLMQNDAVSRYHWMTQAGFLNAVALGQITPGPVVQTVSVVGYAAAGVGGALLAALVAFSPSLAFVVFGGGGFDRLRSSSGARLFLVGAGAAAIGAILGSAIPLVRALTESWQYGVTAAAAIVFLLLRRGVVTTLLGAGAIGVVVALAGGPIPH